MSGMLLAKGDSQMRYRAMRMLWMRGRSGCVTFQMVKQIKRVYAALGCRT
jgi:hypothetical protein